MKNEIAENAVSHSYKILVTKNHLDHLNHVNNIAYLAWVQDASHNHWQLLATKEIKEQVTWMVVRHEIDYKLQAFLNDEITVITWVGESKGVRSIRHVNFYKNDKLLASCKTTWCLLNATTMKPKLIDGKVKDLLTNQ